jgi:hypothetical protein
MRQHAKTTPGATIPARIVRVGVWTVVSAVVLLGSPLLIPGEGSARAAEPSYVGLAGYEPSALAYYRQAMGPGNTVVGRSGDCEIFLADVTVSREHARFSVDASGLSMTDLGSTNGTYVNGRRHDAGRLAEGDELLIGKFHVRVSKGNG